MGPEFIGRVIRTSGWVTPIAALFVAVYYSLGFGAAMIVGTAWACANLYVLSLLVSTLIRPGKRSHVLAALLLCVKLPVLYLLGYLALRTEALPVLGLLAGFWIPKGVIVLKVLGIRLSRRLGRDAHAVRGSRGGGAGGIRGGRAMAFFAVAALALWLVPQLGSSGADALAVSEVAASSETAVIEQEGHGSSSAHGEEQAHGEEEDVHDVGAHDAEHEEGHAELPNFITVIVGLVGRDTTVGHFLHQWENFIFSFLSVIILGVVVSAASKHATMIPGGLQNVVEFLAEKLDDFITGILGPQGRKHVPFLGSLFIYILFMNLFGLVPFMRSPTANLNQTLALALCVFFYVQYTGIRNFGLGGYIFHMAGEPRDPISIALVPIMLPLHIIGELAKPLSLSLRLFGNITGEDVLIVIFVGLGIAILGFMDLPVGLPLHVPFIFLAILTSTIQALVFMLLSTVYFLMMMPHEEH